MTETVGLSMSETHFVPGANDIWRALVRVLLRIQEAKVLLGRLGNNRAAST